MAPYPVHPGALEAYEDSGFAERLERESASDVRFYVRLARAAERVLELGAGRGRVTLPMARAGARVVAVDLSTVLVAELADALRGEALEVRRRVVVKRGDMRSLKLGQTFPLVVAPSDTFCHLYSRADVEGFLSSVRAHLAPEGRLVFDLSMPRLPRLDDSNESVSADQRTDYDAMAQVLSTWGESQGKSLQLARRLFFPRELELLLAHGGFGAVRVDAVSEEKSAEPIRLRVSCRPLRTKGAKAPC